jgi:hypothetical protein
MIADGDEQVNLLSCFPFPCCRPGEKFARLCESITPAAAGVVDRRPGGRVMRVRGQIGRETAKDQMDHEARANVPQKVSPMSSRKSNRHRESDQYPHRSGRGSRETGAHPGHPGHHEEPSTAGLF